MWMNRHLQFKHWRQHVFGNTISIIPTTHTYNASPKPRLMWDGESSTSILLWMLVASCSASRNGPDSETWRIALVARVLPSPLTGSQRWLEVSRQFHDRGHSQSQKGGIHKELVVLDLRGFAVYYWVEETKWETMQNIMLILKFSWNKNTTIQVQITESSISSTSTVEWFAWPKVQFNHHTRNKLKLYNCLW